MSTRWPISAAVTPPADPAWLDPDVGWELPGLGEGDETDAMQVAEVVTLAGDPGNHPVLFHAATGSDRAVVVAALVLSILGVPDADLPFFPTRPDVLAAIRARSGSIEGYLTHGHRPGCPRSRGAGRRRPGGAPLTSARSGPRGP